MAASFEHSKNAPRLHHYQYLFWKRVTIELQQSELMCGASTALKRTWSARRHLRFRASENAYGLRHRLAQPLRKSANAQQIGCTGNRPNHSGLRHRYGLVALSRHTT